MISNCCREVESCHKEVTSQRGQAKVGQVALWTHYTALQARKEAKYLWSLEHGEPAQLLMVKTSQWLFINQDYE